MSKEKGGERGPPRTLPAAANVKVLRVKFNPDPKKVDAGQPVEKGLRNEMFAEIGKKGVSSIIVTDADNKKITEIRISTIGQKDKDN